MPDITTPQYVLFANQFVRPTVDSLITTYENCKRFQDEYAAVGAASIPNTTDNIADGSDVDGRRRMTGQNVNQIKSLVDAIAGYFEGGSGIAALTRIEALRRVNVNGRPTL